MAYSSQIETLLPFCQWPMRWYCFPEFVQIAQLQWLTKKKNCLIIKRFLQTKLYCLQVSVLFKRIQDSM